MVGDDEHRGVLVGEAEQALDLLIDRFVVVEDGVLVRVPRLVQAMLRVEKAPEAVVDAIGAHLDHEEEVPRPGLEKVLGDLEALLRHLLDLGQEAILLPRCGSLDVDHVAADETLDLLLDLRRIGVLASLRVRSEEARNHDAVDAADRIGLRDAEDDYRPPTEGEDVPHAGHAHGAGVGEGERIVGVVAPVAEPIKAERARTA